LPTPTIADLFVPCEEAVKGADWAKAATACEQVRARDAEHPPLAAALATTYLALGKEQLAQGGGIAAALRYFEQAADARPDDPEAQQQLQRAVAYREGSSALAAENWPGAAEKLEAVYAVAPDYLEAAGEDGAKSKLFLALLKWGEALLRDGHFAEAKQRCEQALELAPESEPAKACGAAATAALATPIPRAAPQAQPPQTQPQAQPPRPQPQAQPQPAPQTQPQARPQPQPQAQPPARPQPQAAPAAPALPTRPPAPPVMAPPTRSPY
jgi:tetratricopeptide (TPR) repeat protein